jgi:hypothetical protein
MDADVWAKAKAVLEEALQLRPAQREAWVVEHCDDPVLRREVLTYLREYDETFLEADLSVPGAVDQATPPADEPDKQSSEASR